MDNKFSTLNPEEYFYFHCNLIHLALDINKCCCLLSLQCLIINDYLTWIKIF